MHSKKTATVWFPLFANSGVNEPSVANGGGRYGGPARGGGAWGDKMWISATVITLTLDPRGRNASASHRPARSTVHGAAVASSKRAYMKSARNLTTPTKQRCQNQPKGYNQ
ncbi:hypothetical protein J6590_053504 [Homalodisca vitripennis]|nr:hypothetical protein J6590_053504 [Homalodisca vitripennis]